MIQRTTSQLPTESTHAHVSNDHRTPSGVCVSGKPPFAEIRSDCVDLFLEQIQTATERKILHTPAKTLVDAAIARVPAPFPSLVAYATRCGTLKHLLAREVTADCREAGWRALLHAGPCSPDQAVRIAQLLEHQSWRQSLRPLLSRLIAGLRSIAARRRPWSADSSRRFAAALFLITEPTEEPEIRIQLLRQLEERSRVSPLEVIQLPASVIRSAFRSGLREQSVAPTFDWRELVNMIDRPFPVPDICSLADHLLFQRCVWADEEWCAELIPSLDVVSTAELPTRAMRYLPAPQNRERAREILLARIMPDRLAQRIFAFFLARECKDCPAFLTRGELVSLLAFAPTGIERDTILSFLAVAPSE